MAKVLPDHLVEAARTAFRTDVEFFLPFPEMPWRWIGDGAGEVAWIDGPLIAFRDEVRQLLDELKYDGWPQFQSVLLLIAATRSTWPEHRAWIDVRRQQFGRLHLWELLPMLDRVARLSPELRESVTAKADLLRIIFEGRKPHVAPDATEISLNLLDRFLQLSPPEDRVAKRPTRLAEYRQAQFRFQVGLARISQEAVERRLRTGIERAVRPAEQVKPIDSPASRKLSEHWNRDFELLVVERIARRLVSVLSFPRGLTEPDSLAVGGLTDLSNRGPLDRLLVSELAHDDDTLATRVALNEALYLRRETTSKSTPRVRAAFLDTGLRMWGLPRVMGAAVLLAISQAGESERNLTVSWAASDESGWRSVDRNDDAGILDLLGRLSPRLHAGAALSDWSESIRRGAACPVEPVVVTEFSNLEDEAFVAGLAQIQSPQYDVALVDRSGRFELRRRSAHGWRVIGRATLDLDELLEPPRETASVPLTTGEPDVYPAILRQTEFPLRLPHVLETGRFWPVGANSVIGFASGNRLMWWDAPGRAARQISLRVPSGAVESWYTPGEVIPAWMIAIDAKPPEQSYALWRADRWIVLHVDLTTRTVRLVPLAAERDRLKRDVHGLITATAAFLIGPQWIEAFSLDDGSLLASLSVATPLQFFGNSFVSYQTEWRRLLLHGSTIELARFDPPVPIDSAGMKGQLLVETHEFLHAKPGDVEHPPFELSLAVGQETCLLRLSLNPAGTGKQEMLPIELARVDTFCQAGSFVGLRGTLRRLNGVRYEHQTTVIADISQSSPNWTVSGSLLPAAFLPLATRRVGQPRQLRHRFAEVATGPEGVFLKSAKRGWWKVVLDGQLIRLVQSAEPPTESTSSSFEALKWPGSKFQFHQARLANGNIVWLDSRGLMHLIPATPELQEATLVLDEKRIGGWLADGTTWGHDYYLVDGERVSDARAWNEHLSPFFLGGT